MTDARVVVERTFRAESGAALATLTRMLGDLGAAEDAVQEAFVEALRTWPERGVPGRPGAWITTTARNRALDRVRREARRADREAAAGRATAVAARDAAEVGAAGPPAAADIGGASTGTGDEVVPVDDDQLRMMFTCCHPALAPAAQVALTLRLVCGLRTDEIARAFLQPEPTVAQRLSRAKAKIRATKIPFRVPPGRLLAERLPAVLACVYLVFSEGYAASGRDDLIRDELCDEGIRLARLVAALLPDESEAHGLLALVLLQDSRRAARLGPEGEMVLLEDQDRARWDRGRIAEGQAELARAQGIGPAGSYRAAGDHRCSPRQRPDVGGHRLGAHRRAVRGAGPAGALARGRAEPGGGGGVRRRARGRPGPRGRGRGRRPPRPVPPPPRHPRRSAAPAGTDRRGGRRVPRRAQRSSARRPSGRSSNAGWPTSRRPDRRPD